MTDLNRIKLLHGRKVGVSDWKEITQEMVNSFAELTDDRQWIHVDVDKAKQFMPDTGTIVHGFFTLSLTARLVTNAIKNAVPIDYASIINYGSDKIRFLHAIPVGSSVRVAVTLKDYEHTDKKLKVTYLVEVESNHNNQVVAVIESIMLYHLK
jgi:acyl dehydratase